ncbi:MAG: response regulator transcription factor [Ancrocorticia sp.]|jgi:DNA-binding NarL/FixJ family response regulator|nr:response regulator transcription factor [Ancrocorticia sp.]MCI2193222.1 response regulator transcription factor [Ancrocorticia sp.]MCI2199684.1 response regulator transcription factor [Ancrocorticia sp.]
MALRVLFADDDPIIRGAISRSLEAHPEVELIASVADGIQALEVLGKRHVQIALLDVRMPRLDGVETAEVIRKLYPDVTVVMFTSFEQKSALGRALAAGAKGFLTKDIPINELVRELYRAYQGEDVISPKPTSVLVDTMRNSAQHWREDQDFIRKVEDLPSYLAPILDRLVMAHSYREIAVELELKESTVRSYATQVYTLTGCKNRAELAVRAMRAGYQPVLDGEESRPEQRRELGECCFRVK